MFHTCIFVDPESDGWLRKDFCEDAWNELKPHEQADPEPFSYWRSKFEVPVQVEETNRRMDQDDAETLLRQMMDEDDERTDKARYILVVMLERKKLLMQVGEKQVEDRRLLIYEHTKSGEVFIVTDPGIHLDEVAAVQQEVVTLLDDMAKRQHEDEFEDEDEEPAAAETESNDAEADSNEAEAEDSNQPDAEADSGETEEQKAEEAAPEAA